MIYWIIIILFAVFVVSIIFARSSIIVRVSVRLNNNIKIQDNKSPKDIFKYVDVLMGPDNIGRNPSYEKKVRLSEFLSTDNITLSSLDDTLKISKTRMNSTFIKVSEDSEHKNHFSCVISDNPKLSSYLKFTATTTGSNKSTIGIISAIVTILSIVVLMLFNYLYYSDRTQELTNLNENITAIQCSDEDNSTLTLNEYEQTSEKVYYSELPNINLIVITKDSNTFVDSDSKFNNPVTVNTVLMFYEDNLSGRLNIDDTSEVELDDYNPNCKYYNLTELYLNIPIVVEGYSEIRTLGELFQGDVIYNDETGYNGVKSWFRDIYHINISSVTEIPQSVFSDCFGMQSSLSINLNQDFIKFMYYNYVDTSSTSEYYSCISTKDMLLEGKPTFSESLKGHILEATNKLGLNGYNSSLNNAMIFLDGSSIVTIGNTVRMAGQDSEYDYLLKMGYYSTISNSTVTQWSDTLSEIYAMNPKLDTIVHSNWDIILTDLFESLSNMNNNTYKVFCKENHSDVLSNIKTSLTSNEMDSFLYSICKANATLGDSVSKEKQFIFNIRNLDLGVTTTLGQPNVYTLKQPLEDIVPYTNRLVKTSLYYCLKATKGTS
ncbi:MAG: hypothetical protein LIO71_00130 [Ruminococcus sp.]|nr:hypothetical protein [Ruminococcus sp.]